MDLFVQMTHLLIQWVSGICIFLLFYIWFFKKYQNSKSHVFTIYFAIIGFSFISEVLKNIFPQLEYSIRFGVYFIIDPLSILVLAFFISVLSLDKPVKKYSIIFITLLLVINLLPHLPFDGSRVSDPLYPKYTYWAISTFLLTILSLVKMIRDYGKSGKIAASLSLWGFLGITYVQKVAGVIFSGTDFYQNENSTYAAILLLMTVLSFLLLVRVFYEAIVRNKNSLKASLSKAELLSMSEDELVYHIHNNHSELIDKLKNYKITDRELVVIFLALFGISIKECADYLNVSIKTIDQYKYRLKKKFGLSGTLIQNLNELKVDVL